MLMSRMYHEAPEEYRFYPETWVLPAEMNDFRFERFQVWACSCACVHLRVESDHTSLLSVAAEQTPVTIGGLVAEIFNQQQTAASWSMVPQDEVENPRDLSRTRQCPAVRLSAGR